MVIEFDCIVAICVLLISVTFYTFSLFLFVFFLSFLHEDKTFTMYYRWPELIAYKSSLAASGRQL